MIILSFIAGHRFVPGMQTEKDIAEFKSLLENKKHYSEALVNLLIKKLDANEITTFQEINDLIFKDTSAIIKHFSDHPEDIEYIERKNPLCLESMRDYLMKLFRVVSKVCGQDIKKFIEALKMAFKNQLEVISNLTPKTSQVGLSFLLTHQYKSILVYNYSKSISQTLKSLSKILGPHLQVYVCSSGLTGQGEKMFNDLSMAQVNCSLIADAESGYYIDEVDCMLTGAEVVLDDGSVINRTGTALLALWAWERKKPVVVFAETYKFIKKTLLTQKDIPNFARFESRRKEPIILTDLTKGKYISVFCTDVGCIAPEAVSLRMSSLIV